MNGKYFQVFPLYFLCVCAVFRKFLKIRLLKMSKTISQNSNFKTTKITSYAKRIYVYTYISIFFCSTILFQTKHRTHRKNTREGTLTINISASLFNVSINNLWNLQLQLLVSFAHLCTNNKKLKILYKQQNFLSFFFKFQVVRWRRFI